MHDGGVALHPHPAALLGQEAVVFGGHLTLDQHCGEDGEGGDCQTQRKHTHTHTHTHRTGQRHNAALKADPNTEGNTGVYDTEQQHIANGR